MCSCLGFGKILSWTMFGYMFGFNENLIGRRYVKIGYGCSFLGFLRGNYSYPRIERVRVLGKPEIV